MWPHRKQQTVWCVLLRDWTHTVNKSAPFPWYAHLLVDNKKVRHGMFRSLLFLYKKQTKKLKINKRSENNRLSAYVCVCLCVLLLYWHRSHHDISAALNDPRALKLSHRIRNNHYWRIVKIDCCCLIRCVFVLLTTLLWSRVSVPGNHIWGNVESSSQVRR